MSDAHRGSARWAYAGIGAVLLAVAIGIVFPDLTLVVVIVGFLGAAMCVAGLPFASVKGWRPRLVVALAIGAGMLATILGPIAVADTIRDVAGTAVTCQVLTAEHSGSRGKQGPSTDVTAQCPDGVARFRAAESSGLVAVPGGPVVLVIVPGGIVPPRPAALVSGPGLRVLGGAALVAVLGLGLAGVAAARSRRRAAA